MGVLEDLLDFLNQNQTDPVTYLILLFLFSIAIAVILPIPIEIALFWNPTVPIFIKAVVLGAGKAVGGLAVFRIGLQVEKTISRWSKYRFYRWIMKKSEAFVERYGYFALYVLLSIPGMLDTVPLYLFSIFNKEGTAMEWRYFVIVNFIAGVNRAMIFWAIAHLFGIFLY